MPRLNEYLHDLGPRQTRVLQRIFPTVFCRTPKNRCIVPTCRKPECQPNRDGWSKLTADVDKYADSEVIPSDLEPLCYQGDRTSRQQRFFPSSYLGKMSEGKDTSRFLTENEDGPSSCLYVNQVISFVFLEMMNSVTIGAGRYDGNTIPPLLEYLKEQGWQLEDVVTLCGIYCRRVYSLYQNSGGKRRAPSTFPSQQLPLCFYDVEKKRLLSFRHRLPTTLSPSYLGTSCFSDK